jgi:hypothetical protein
VRRGELGRPLELGPRPCAVAPVEVQAREQQVQLEAVVITTGAGQQGERLFDRRALLGGGRAGEEERALGHRLTPARGDEPQLADPIAGPLRLTAPLQGPGRAQALDQGALGQARLLKSAAGLGELARGVGAGVLQGEGAAQGEQLGFEPPIRPDRHRRGQAGQGPQHLPAGLAQQGDPPQRLGEVERIGLLKRGVGAEGRGGQGGSRAVGDLSPGLRLGSRLRRPARRPGRPGPARAGRPSRGAPGRAR